MRVNVYRTEMDENENHVLVKEKGYNYTKCKSLDKPKLVVEMLNDIFALGKRSEEYVYMLAMGIRYQLKGVFEISHGTESKSLCDPREIFIKALLTGAHSVILVHNHPSGDLTASKEDGIVFERIKQSGKLIGIPLTDSIIVTRDGYFSLLSDFLASNGANTTF